MFLLFGLSRGCKATLGVGGELSKQRVIAAQNVVGDAHQSLGALIHLRRLANR